MTICSVYGSLWPIWSVCANRCTTYDCLKIWTIIRICFWFEFWFLNLLWTSFIKPFTLLLITGHRIKELKCVNVNDRIVWIHLKQGSIVMSIIWDWALIIWEVCELSGDMWITKQKYVSFMSTRFMFWCYEANYEVHHYITG